MAEVETRRRLLLRALVAGAVALPGLSGRAWAQSAGTLKLLRAPKTALVVGCGAYTKLPSLPNAANDARQVATQLEAAGFEVTLLLDANRQVQAEAAAAHTRTLAARQSIGLFYFAGHGMQLQWRNYLLPVDATLSTAEDIPHQGLDVSGLLAGFGRASNPMNVVILDACRNNPFSGSGEPKGLSQMDAPPHTLLAYATAPGHEASDGLGANGLYTEHLLREMKVREARIEDVFKRVRLGVRRASGGLQVPWESTSLEEDFWFHPPEAMQRRSAEEEERAFREELAEYERVAASPDPAPVEAFLRQYPSGRFAELAQRRLDVLLAAAGEAPLQPANAAGNPFTAGTARATAFRVGDRYTYDQHDRRAFGGKPQRITNTVTQVTDSQVVFDGGRAIRDLLGNQVRFRDGRETTPRQDQPLEYVVGKRWSTRFDISKGGVAMGSVRMDFRIAGRETVTVPAGTFDCFRIEASGVNRLSGRPDLEVIVTRWHAPERVRVPIAMDETSRMVVSGHVTTKHATRLELVEFRQS